MDDLIAYLNNSIQDELFSKNEKREFKSLLNERKLDQHRISVLRSKIYELADKHVNEKNYQFILEWVRTATGALDNQEAPSLSDAFFSPGDACRSAIINQINSATRQLQICVFTISDDTIVSSLLTARKKGLDIKIITDNDKSLDIGSDIDQLAKAGIAVRMDNSPNHMHHKFMISDQQRLITGSYNWTLSAARYNHENILLTHDPGVVKSFASEFENLWKKMEAYR